MLRVGVTCNRRELEAVPVVLSPSIIVGLFEKRVALGRKNFNRLKCMPFDVLY